MESGFLQTTTELLKGTKESFYPCFNGIRVLTLETLIHEVLHTVVSILVLMESGFLPNVEVVEVVENQEGFYPCFNGIRVLTRLNNRYSICNHYSTYFYFLILKNSYYIYTFSCITTSFPHRFLSVNPFNINAYNFIHFCFSKKYPQQFFDLLFYLPRVYYYRDYYSLLFRFYPLILI